MGPTESFILLVLAAVAVGLALRWLVWRRFPVQDTDPRESEAAAGVTVGAHGSFSRATYRALLSSHRPAYRAARNLSIAAKLMVIVGSGVLVWGLLWMDAGYARKEMAAPLFLVAGFASLVGGLIFAAIASILRAVLDRTAFTAPGLEDADRVRLAYEAGGEDPPL